MKFALCDDDSRELKLMTDFLLQFDPQADFQCFLSAQKLLDAYREDHFDIVLLDIEMQEPNGYQAAQELNKLPTVPLIIFVTQSGDYTIRGYEVAFRYLKKPVSYSDFERAVLAATSKIVPKRLAVGDGERTVFLHLNDVIYIEIYGYTAIFHTCHGMYRNRISLKKLEKDLTGCGFVRPHNSFLVNLEYMDHIQNNMLQLTNGANIPLSRNRQKSFHKALSNFLKRW